MLTTHAICNEIERRLASYEGLVDSLPTNQGPGQRGPILEKIKVQRYELTTLKNELEARVGL